MKKGAFFTQPPVKLQASISKKLNSKDVASLAKTSKYSQVLVDNHDKYHYITEGYKIVKNMTIKPHPALEDYLKSENGLYAVGRNLISLEQLQNLYLAALNFLKTENALAALREKLITVEDFNTKLYPAALDYLKTEDGLAALREKLITVEDFNTKLYPAALDYLKTDNGSAVLKEKLISIDELKVKLPRELQKLFSDESIAELRQQNTSSLRP